MGVLGGFVLVEDGGMFVLAGEKLFLELLAAVVLLHDDRIILNDGLVLLSHRGVRVTPGAVAFLLKNAVVLLFLR